MHPCKLWLLAPRFMCCKASKKEIADLNPHNMMMVTDIDAGNYVQPCCLTTHCCCAALLPQGTGCGQLLPALTTSTVALHPVYACAGVLDPAALAAFDWLVDEVEKMGGMQLMMTLTNCLSDYGGMQQYVR